MRSFFQVALLTLLTVSLVTIDHVAAANVQRSGFSVQNLTCTSCLSNIESELRGIPGAIGMDADLQRGRVMVDHTPTLQSTDIAAAITRLGYPAQLEWSGTLANQRPNTFGRSSRSGGGCGVSGGGGGCGGPAASGPSAWGKTVPGQSLSRSTFQVDNLTCTSCLANIQAELQTMKGTLAMQSNLQQGLVIVDHDAALQAEKIAAAISGLGYPATAKNSQNIKEAQLLAAAASSNSPQSNIATRIGKGGCNSKSPCNANSAALKGLYNKYFTKTSN